MLEKSNKKVINAWAMYDWANSVYSLIIISAVFPVYYIAVTTHGHNDKVFFFGVEFINTALYSYSIAFAFLLASIITPVLLGIAEQTGRKKFFMQFFCYLGSLACAGLYFFTGENIEIGILCSLVACLSYVASLVFYSAYLPEIAQSNEHESIATKGFSYGLIGSTLLLMINIIVILYPQAFHIEDASKAVRLSFLSVGLWWAGFAQITFKALPKSSVKGILKGYHELIDVWRELPNYTVVKNFLMAFLFYIMSVQTVMYAATLFVIKEVHMKDEELIPTIFIIQIVAIGGAYVFSWLSSKTGNIKSLLVSILVWIVVCASACFVKTAIQFMILAFALGLGLGGVMVLSKSTYTKLLPETLKKSAYYNFYDFIEKITLFIGMFLYGYIEVITGSMRASVLFFTMALIVGSVLLVRLHKPIQ